MKVIIATLGTLLAYIALSWVMGSKGLGLSGTKLYIFLAVLSILGILAAAAFLWFRRKMRREKAAEAGGATEQQGEADEIREIDELIRDAESKLKASKLVQDSGIGNLPVFLLAGGPSTTKTSSMIQSGLEAELLTGQVYQENNVVSTRAVNLWFARNAIFAEAGGKLVSEPARWQRLVKKLQPKRLKSVVGASGQAPRAAIVFFDCETFTRPGAGDQISAAARNLQTRLSEIAQAYGISLPVYVIFSKGDRIPFFADYVRNLNNDEATRVLGATLPMTGNLSSGVYAEEQAQRLNTVFDRIFHALADKRLEFLPRENDPARLPGAYEFPREFRKLRNFVVQFLVDLCRPSQLTASPFLRGFYFSGVRPVVVQEMSAGFSPRQPERKSFEAAGNATRMFKAGVPQMPGAEQVQPQVTGTRKVPQWLFLSHLFSDVILQDKPAMGASGASTRTSMLRRILFASAAALCLIFAIGFVVSYFGNNSLEDEAIQAARNIGAAEATGESLPSADSLQRLEVLRQSLQRLTVYQQEGPPWRLRWFLYAGNDMYPEVRRIYYDRFRQLLFGYTQARMLGYLQRAPGTPDPGYEYGKTYDTLKAYLITTSHHDRSTRMFLAPVLLNRWSEAREVDAERMQLARLQFEFYAGDLARANPYSPENDTAAVERSRRYLSQFSGVQQVYQFMLAEAARKNPGVNFNQKFPGSAQVVVNNRDIAGGFTKGGWNFMQDAIKRSDQFLGGEKWVLGEYASARVDRAQLEQELRDLYQKDFIEQWRAYFRNTTVARYSNLKDAAEKLNKLSSNQSPLLALFWLATQNTAIDSPKVKEAFQPVHLVEPPENVDRYLAPGNQPYMTALLALQVAIDQAAAQPVPPPDIVQQTLSSAVNAKMATKQVAQGFGIDPEANLGGIVQKLMEDPITNAEGLLRGLGAAELNAKGKAVCGQFAALTNKFPFNPKARAEATLQEVSAIFRPKEGSLWQFYESDLANKLMVKQGEEYAAKPGGEVSLTPAFVQFFNRAARFSEALYPEGAKDPNLNYSVRPLPSEQIDSMTLTVNGQSEQFGKQAGAKKFSWPGKGSPQVQLSARLKGGTPFEFPGFEGLWAVFRFFADADRSTPSGGGYNLEWVVRQGREAQPLMIGGKPLTYSFFVDTGVFRKDFLSSMKCVSQVAR